MSIYVDNEPFCVEVKYQEVRDKDGRVVGVKILPLSASGPGVEHCVCEAVGRDFDNMSTVLESCSAINHITGNPMLQISKFYKMIFLRFFRSWNLYENAESETSLPITLETIGAVHDKVIRSLVKKWLSLTDGNVEED